ncbi:hypothetical protein ACFX1W_007329 [Malus domestica]
MKFLSIVQFVHHLKSQREGIIDRLINESLDGSVTDGIFLEEPGSGAVVTIENKKVSVGTLEWAWSYPFEEIEAHTSQSIVYVGIDSTLAGLIYFEDQIRVDAGQVVKSLSKQGSMYTCYLGTKQ